MDKRILRSEARFIYRLKQETNGKIIIVEIILILLNLMLVDLGNADLFLIIIQDKNNIYFLLWMQRMRGLVQILGRIPAGSKERNKKIF